MFQVSYYAIAVARWYGDRTRCGMASVRIGSTKWKEKRTFAVTMELWMTQVRNDGTEDSKWAALELILFYSFLFFFLLAFENLGEQQ